MIFFIKGDAPEADPKDGVPWIKRFAFLPVCVSMNCVGLRKYVWLGMYEFRKYYLDVEAGWVKEYRLPYIRCFFK